MTFKTYFSEVCLFLVCGTALWAQTGTIRGTVRDVKRNPLPGANIQITENEIGTATDDDGSFPE